MSTAYETALRCTALITLVVLLRLAVPALVSGHRRRRALVLAETGESERTPGRGSHITAATLIYGPMVLAAAVLLVLVIVYPAEACRILDHVARTSARPMPALGPN